MANAIATAKLWMTVIGIEFCFRFSRTGDMNYYEVTITSTSGW